MSLTPTELSQVCKHLGHTKEVHHSYYRHHEQLVETNSISRLLMLSEKGQVHQYKGKKLSDVDLPEPDEFFMVADGYTE